MLKLRLSPSRDDFEKSMETLSNAFRKIVDEARGELRIYAYPSRDSLIAAAYIFKRLLALGSRPTIGVSPRPPQITGPTLLLGFDYVNYKASEVGDTVLSITSGEVRGSPVVNLYLVEVEGSCSAAAALAASEVLGFRGSWDVLVALAGSLTGRYVEKNGRFHGVDKILLEEVSRIETYSLEVLTTLKAYKPGDGSVCESIARTVNPYYPKMTGDPGFCMDVLRAGGVEDLGLRSLDSIRDEDELSRLATTILSQVERFVQGSRGEDLVEEYLGGVPQSRSPTSPIRDVRMAADALTLAMEVGGVESLVASVSDLDSEYIIAERSLEDLASRFGEIVDEAKPRKLRAHPRYRVYLVDAPDDTPLYLLWKALTLTGLVERESILAVEAGGGEAMASPMQAEEAFKEPGTVRRLVESRLARMEDGVLWLNIDVMRR